MLIIASFIGVAVFGFAAFGSKHGENGTLCLANIAKSFGCLEETRNFALANWHVNVFKNFSTALLLVLGLMLLVALTRLLGKGLNFLPFAVSGFVKIENRSFLPQIQRRLAAWMQTLEKRDPAN